MVKINYDNRFFVPIVYSEAGEVSFATVFHYRQKGDVVWATYEGGGIRFGTLIAKILPSDQLDMRYTHVNISGELMAGECISTPEVMGDGRIRLYEKWRWTCGTFASGESVIEEIEPEGERWLLSYYLTNR